MCVSGLMQCFYLVESLQSGGLPTVMRAGCGHIFNLEFEGGEEF